MSEIVKNQGINIIFRNASREIDRITVSSDKEAQNVIRERMGFGDIPIACTTGNDAIDLTEKYRIQESSGIFSIKR